jgi:hypothetical protein
MFWRTMGVSATAVGCAAAATVTIWALYHWLSPHTSTSSQP